MKLIKPAKGDERLGQLIEHFSSPISFYGHNPFDDVPVVAVNSCRFARQGKGEGCSKGLEA